MKEHIQDILVGGRPMTKLEQANKEIERLKLIIATAIRIYEKCEESQDYSTCDLDMYEVLKGVNENG